MQKRTAADGAGRVALLVVFGAISVALLAHEGPPVTPEPIPPAAGAPLRSSIAANRTDVTQGAAAVVSTRMATQKGRAIAHRGASAYAPEHTVAAYELAIAQGADYVEQDLAVTRDQVLICLHDESLERTTDVEEVFPDRSVVDPATGRRTWLAMDFTLAEIKRLDAGRWFDARFAGQRIPTWEEAVAVVGDRAGLYPELKTPALYRSRGIDQTGLFVESLRRLGLARRPPGTLIVQSFDDQPLRELAQALPTVPRTFLLEMSDAEWLTPERLKEIRSFATGIGPAKGLLTERPDAVTAAHAAGLTVTPYTFTTRAAPATSRFPSLADEMRYFLDTLGVDALFTDNPDLFPRSAPRQ